MPVVESLMTSLTARYGLVEGENVYYAMEASGRGPFAKGRKYHDLHLTWAEESGVPPIEPSTSLGRVPAKASRRSPGRPRGRGRRSG
jgi:hypothetical protein